MTDKTKRFFDNQWVVAIGTGIILIILPSIYDWVKSYPFLTTISRLFKAFISLFIIEIRIYWVIIGTGIIYGLYKLIKNRKNPIKTEDEFLKYKSDRFKSLRWRWDWDYNKNDNEWNLVNLTPFCPFCDTVLKKSFDSWRLPIYECPRCNKCIEGNDYEDSHDIELLVLDNLRRNYRAKVHFK